MEVKNFYNLIKNEFLKNNIDASDANALFDYFYGTNFLVNCKPVEKKLEKQLLKIAKKRIQTREPIYSIIGYAPFYGRFFKTHKKVLKPRLDTEVMLSEALKITNKNSKVLDLCCGTGILGITLNLETNANVVCSDIIRYAINLTKLNSKLLNANVTTIKSDMFKNISGKFDVIVCNPPYIKSESINGLEVEVKKFDPHLALDGGSDGTKFYKIISKTFEKFLTPNGVLILEIGFDQANDIKNIFKNYNIEIKKDFNNLDRVAIVKLKG